MKHVVRKSQEEREKEAAASIHKLKVEESGSFYWTCDRCNVVFLDGDEILKDSTGVHRCPLITGRFFKRQCLNHMWGGEEDSLERYYKIL